MNTIREDAAVLEYCQQTVASLKNHLGHTYREDDRTKAIMAKMHDIRLLNPSVFVSGSGSYYSGAFNHENGVLMVASRDATGKIRTHKSLNKTIVHEMAHATRFKYPGETSHSGEWKSAWVWLLNIATGELKMDVEVPCSSVTFYGLEQSECPSCDWDSPETSCAPFTGPPR